MPTNTSTATTTKGSNTKNEGNLKLLVQKSDLFRGIQTVQSAISVRSTLPVLGNILFEATEKGLRLSATDLEVGIRTWVKADISETGSITIPAKILSDFIRTLEDDREISIKTSDANKVDIRSKKDKLNIIGLPRADYPVLPEFDETKSTTISRKTLRELIKKTIYATSTDETRYVLNGIHFIIENGEALAVATDGRRLAYIKREIDDKKLQAKVIVPSKAITEVLRLIGDDKSGDDQIRLTLTDNQASFSTGDTIVLSRLIEGHFPNFEQVIPKTHEIQITLKRGEFQSSVTRAAVGTLERGGSIKLTLSKGQMRILAAAQGRVEVESEIAVNYEGSTFDIAFNPAYVLDVLKSLDQDEVYLELTSPLNPGVIRPANEDSHRYIMMPMKA